MNHTMNYQRGNIFLLVFLGIVLVGALTVAIRGFSAGNQTITQEQLMIQAAQTIRYGAELEQAVKYVLDNGASEADIRFAAPSANAVYGTISTTPNFQVFSQSGGRAQFRYIPAQITAPGTSYPWDFYGTTAVPGTGSAKADLIAVVPDVSVAFCQAINKMLKITAIPNDPVDGTTPDSVDGGSSYYFGAGAGYLVTPNTVSTDASGVTQACVVDGSSRYHYFRVLLAR